MNKESRETMVCAGSTRDADISEGKTKRKKSLNHALLIAFFTYITLIRSLLWITPSPLMPTLMEELNLSYAQSGQLIFIVPVVMGVFLFIGSFVIDFLGPSLAITIGLAALAADGLLSSLSTSFTFLLLGHLLCGAGFGLTVGAIPALVAERFKGSSQVYVNSYNVAITPVGMALCYAIIIPMTNYFGSWKTVYFVWAAISLVGGILFYLFERKAISLHFVQRRVNKTNQTSQMRGIIGALRFKDIWWMTLAMGGSLWLYNAFSSYLPSFLSTEKT